MGQDGVTFNAERNLAGLKVFYGIRVKDQAIPLLECHERVIAHVVELGAIVIKNGMLFGVERP